MEDFVGNMKSRGTTLRNDRNARMAQPPRSYNRLYEDFGSDFGSSSRKGASNGTKNTNTHKALQDFDTSIDELDFLSQHSSDVEVSSPRKSSQTGTSKALKEGGFWIDGVYHEPAKGFEADGRAKLKGLKFKKNKSTASNASQDATTPSLSTAKHVPTGVTSRPPPSNSLNKPFRTPGFVNKGEGPSRPAPPISRPPTPPQTPDWFHDEELEDTPRPPKPRPKTQTVSSSLGIKRIEDEPTRTSVKGKTKATAADFPMELPLKETSNSKPKPGLSQRPIKAPFPLDTLSSSSSKGENVKESGPKKRRPASPPFSKPSSQEPRGSKRDVPGEAATGPLERKKKQPAKAPFEDMFAGTSEEPRGSASRKRIDRSPEEIPPLSPPSSSSTRASTTKGSKSKPKLKAKVSKGTIYSSEDTEDDSARPKARPFPMATQMFAAVEPSSAKRGSSSPISDPDSDGTGERRGRKRARGADEIMRELMYSDGLDGEEDEAALFMDPDLDPSRLCPWCDELLPPAPSPHLQHLIDIARNRSVKDARPTNPLGLHAAPTVFINVCQRHRFERNQIPLAQERGWPTQIEWSKLGSRVRRQRHYLQRLVDDVDEEFLPGNERQREETVKEGEEDARLARDDDSLLATRPRKGSAFWIEVVRNVRRKGAQKAAGVRGQMSNFSKIQPGYYGELGSVIISQTIYDLFPPASFPTNSTLPLTPAEFIQGILVPEAALALVMEDMDQTRAEALRTLRDSAQYGVAMFPDDAQEGNSASEAIVKARAAARREELLREEQREAEEEDALWGAFSDPIVREVEVAPQSSQASIDRPRRECARRTAPIVESSDDDSDVSMASARSKKPRSKKPVSRRQAKTKVADPGADVFELSDTPEFSKPPSRATAKARSKAASEAASDVMEISDASSSAKPRPKPRPRTKTGAYDTDTKTSDIEAPPSSNPGLAAPVVTFGARGEMQKRVRREDGTIETIDLERTPKAKKRVTSGSKSFALKIMPLKTRDTSRPPTDNEWSRNLYDAKYPSSDDL